MELSGRSPGYRGIAIRCPGCAESMAIERLAEADVDVCSGCRGLWVDWFDGEVRTVAAEVLAAETAKPPPVPAPSSELRNESHATGACPRCTRQLVVERFVIRAIEAGAHEPDERVATGRRTALSTGTDVLRCEECAGVFVARPSAEVLAALSVDDAPPESIGPRGVEPLPWERLASILRRWLGLVPPSRS